MSWTALVPLKAAGQRKTRLAGSLDPQRRHAVSERMAGHVIGLLQNCDAIDAVHVLAPCPWPGAGWLRDGGQGLNAELERALALLGEGPVVILHADLPLLHEDDLHALLDGATRSGCALAPDAHEAGTNAVAMDRGIRIPLSFGPDSLPRHVGAARAIGVEPALVRSRGLSLDVDVAADLMAAEREGWTQGASIKPTRNDPPVGA